VDGCTNEAFEGMIARLRSARAIGVAGELRPLADATTGVPTSTKVSKLTPSALLSSLTRNSFFIVAPLLDTVITPIGITRTIDTIGRTPLCPSLITSNFGATIK
jgi:hypothetical protein